MGRAGRRTSHYLCSTFALRVLPCSTLSCLVLSVFLEFNVEEIMHQLLRLSSEPWGETKHREHRNPWGARFPTPTNHAPPTRSTTTTVVVGRTQKVYQELTQTKPYNTLPPWNGGIAGRPDIRADVSISKRFHFLGIPGRVFSSPTWEKSEKSLLSWCGRWDSNPRPKNTWSCRRRHLLR